MKSNPRQFWRWLKSTRNGRTDLPSIQLLDGEEALTTDEQKADLFNHFFSSVFTEEDHDGMPGLLEELNRNANPDCLQNFTIDQEAVLDELTHLNTNKCGGPDGIPGILLKEGAVSIAPSLSRIYNLSLSLGILPRDWTRANVVPIFKKGNKHRANNYRPISLTSHVVKTIERIVSKKMKEFVLPVLVPVQHGFRPGNSCLTQLLSTIHQLAESLDKGLTSHAIFLDFSKAFDSVPHQRLLAKLDSIGIRGSILRWIKAFLTNRQQRVIINGASSDWTGVTSGVPQGTVLGPLLFLIYINDIVSNIRHSSTSLFADDCALYRTINDANDCILLQEDLDAISNWSVKWQLCLNYSKCKVLNITNKKKLIPCNYSLDDNKLEEVATYKYLGVTLDNKLKWSCHVTDCVARANRILALLRRTMFGCTGASKEQAYKALVKPILEYGVPAWHPSTKKMEDALEKVQQRAARWIDPEVRWLPDKKKWSTSYAASLMNLRWLSLSRSRLFTTNYLTFKLLNNFYPILSEKLQTSHQRKNRLISKKSRINVFRFSYFINAPFLWNDLPNCIIESPSISSFKHALFVHLFNNQ